MPSCVASSTAATPPISHGRNFISPAPPAPAAVATAAPPWPTAEVSVVAKAAGRPTAAASVGSSLPARCGTWSRSSEATPPAFRLLLPMNFFSTPNASGASMNAKFFALAPSMPEALPSASPRASTRLPPKSEPSNALPTWPSAEVWPEPSRPPIVPAMPLSTLLPVSIANRPPAPSGVAALAAMPPTSIGRNQPIAEAIDESDAPTALPSDAARSGGIALASMSTRLIAMIPVLRFFGCVAPGDAPDAARRIEAGFQARMAPA